MKINLVDVFDAISCKYEFDAKFIELPAYDSLHLLNSTNRSTYRVIRIRIVRNYNTKKRKMKCR